MATLPSEIFFRDDFSIAIQEYQSTSVTAKKGHAKKTATAKMKFSFFRLSVAVAKSILTRNPSDIDLVKEVRSAFYALDSMISSSGTELRVCAGFRKKYRDFSKSGRTGELAQALSFILSQEHLEFPLIIDFDGFLESQNIPLMANDQRTPDFALLFKGGTVQPSLIESKGSCPATDSLSVKGKLNDSLQQCDAADLHIATNAARTYRIKNSYGTLSRLAECDDAWDSVVCFCDPVNDTTEGMEFPLNAARRYYAAWLTICGHIDLASALDKNQLNRSAVRNWKELLIGGQKFSIPSSPNGTFNLFTPFLAFRRPGTLQENCAPEWAIRTDLINALVDNDAEELSGLFRQTAPRHTDLENGNIYFADHTVFRLPRQSNKK